MFGCAKPINDETLIDKGGLKYHPDTKELYSGKVFKNRMGGKKEFEGSYKVGKKEGLWTYYYKNGTREETTYKDGEYDGLRTSWYEDGKKIYEGTYKDGELDGVRTRWYENGQKSSEHTYKDGKPNGLRTSWYENGQKRWETLYKDGDFISKKCWDNDGIEKESD